MVNGHTEKCNILCTYCNSKTGCEHSLVRHITVRHKLLQDENNLSNHSTARQSGMSRTVYETSNAEHIAGKHEDNQYRCTCCEHG